MAADKAGGKRMLVGREFRRLRVKIANAVAHARVDQNFGIDQRLIAQEIIIQAADAVAVAEHGFKAAVREVHSALEAVEECGLDTFRIEAGSGAKQRTGNVRSSTRREILGVDRHLPAALL